MPDDLPLYEGDDGTVYTPIHGTPSAAQLREVWRTLEEAQESRDDYVRCSVCGLLVEKDPRGDVLDSSGRCDECRP